MYLFSPMGFFQCNLIIWCFQKTLRENPSTQRECCFTGNDNDVPDNVKNSLKLSLAPQKTSAGKTRNFLSITEKKRGKTVFMKTRNNFKR